MGPEGRQTHLTLFSLSHTHSVTFSSSNSTFQVITFMAWARSYHVSVECRGANRQKWGNPSAIYYTPKSWAPHLKIVGWPCSLEKINEIYWWIRQAWYRNPAAVTTPASLLPPSLPPSLAIRSIGGLQQQQESQPATHRTEPTGWMDVVKLLVLPNAPTSTT